jgi:hypothetical protein
MKFPQPIRCACGRPHADETTLEPVGTQSVFDDEEERVIHTAIWTCPLPCNTSVCAIVGPEDAERIDREGRAFRRRQRAEYAAAQHRARLRGDL